VIKYLLKFNARCFEENDDESEENQLDDDGNPIEVFDRKFELYLFKEHNQGTIF